MPPKRRMLVVFEPEVDKKRQKRITVSIDSDATNAELAKEIAATLKQEDTLTLEIAGGFELRGQDGVEVIHDGDIVTAKPSTNTARSSSPLSIRGRPDTTYIAQPDEPCRMQVRLVTAELARDYAKETPKECSEPTNGVLAFEGEFISGNTTLNALQREAARVFDWSPEDDMLIDDETCQHDQEGACSCAIAQEVVQYGLFSTLHCRFTLDGTNCSNAECPYSHIKLNGGVTGHLAPHCSVCEDALGFPCPGCIDRANASNVELGSLVHCPLVQNAGCGHLHHAHCLGPRKDEVAVSCPSGCLPDKFPREAAVLDMDQRHLIVAWAGDKIDKVPVPTPTRGGFLEGSSICLPTDVVISVVEAFLASKNFALPGLSLRLHSRDPTNETVRFTQSTLVSVCSSSTHTNQNYRRFELFPEKTYTPQARTTNARDFFVDFHTSQSPIVACGCTSLKQLFATTADLEGQVPPSVVVLYVVKRKNNAATETEDSRRGTASKQETYLADAAWQPSILQSYRGMAALLSSLYLLAHSVPQKGIDGEQKVLAMTYAVTRFPPAVRALAILFINRTPLPEERAALSEALFHALKDFASRGPTAITSDPSRRFEAVRILLAHLLTARDTPSSTPMIRSFDDISLICAVSHKQLTDPVTLDTLVVQRELAILRQRGGELYRPAASTTSCIVTELSDSDPLRQLLSYCRALPSKSTLALRVERIGMPPPSCSYTLDSVGRDFVVAIRRANETDLITRGPLELKSINVIAPQIVLDEEGLLAVFTGRGCGSTRDVNFFRPTNGGDTEVDVNDVSHALEKVIVGRKVEDTWQVDSFGGVSALSRPPDEAIVLCLDLSESMNKRSGVSRSANPAPNEKEFDVEVESVKVVDSHVKDFPDSTVLQKAKTYLDEQHPSCHFAWKAYLDGDSSDDDSLDSDNHHEHDPEDLIVHLGTMARRDVLRLNNEDEENRLFFDIQPVIKLACFASACSDQQEALVDHLVGLLDDLEMSERFGVAPYDVPRQLLDPRTGDLLLDPVRPKHAPNKTTFVNEDSKSWFESQEEWPTGHFAPSLSTPAKVRQAVAKWISGSDLLPKEKATSKKGKGKDVDDLIEVTLQHDGKETVWRLSTSSTTRTLYSLVNRATRARYSSFTLRLSESKAVVTDSADIPLGFTYLSHGGSIEISRAVPHLRWSYEVDVEFGPYQSAQKILLPQDASILALISCIHARNIGRLSDVMLWHGLKKSGDGVRRGTIVNNESSVRHFASFVSHSVTFECQAWFWSSSGAQQEREASWHLTRLHLLKELFNVFLNRAGSFDTSVSLVLGLVTFSDQAGVKQELTPVFENFRQQLDRVRASGDTAVYDALDIARGVLVSYRRDLPSLRKRIIIVSDGDDTSSKSPAYDVCQALQKNKIIVDSVQVGSQSNSTLHAISVATGGYRFSPRTSLADALSIFDLETMLHSGERPFRPAMPPVISEFKLWEYGNTHIYPIDVVTVDRFPQRAEHAKLQQSVKPAATSLDAHANDDRLKRIMREIKALVADPHPQIDVYVNDRDISFLKVILEAPKDVEQCPYKSGTFLLTCDLPQGYPRDPPEIRFVTFILHPNVSKQGKVCIAELGRLWSSDITLKETFSLIYGLLLEPDLENPLEMQASLKYYDDDGTYALAVANAVADHASKSRAAWREELEDE